MDRKEAFSSLDIETQYSVYLCGVRSYHPPLLYLVIPFASQGRPVAELLKLKLAQATDDLTIRDIIVVFAEMHRQRSYIIDPNDDLRALLKSKVASMKDAYWKQNCEQILMKMQL
jgi:hypothetical protein